MRLRAIPPAVLLLALLPHGAGATSSLAALYPPPAIVGHRAFYTLTLKSSTEEGVLSASGTMEYDVTDACSGYATSQHLALDMTDRDGRDAKMVNDYATFESRDGTRLNFHSRQTTDGSVTDTLDGTAALDRPGGRGHVDYVMPEHKRVFLPSGTMLPNAHTLAILQAGLAGKRFLAVPLFDGTGADGAQDSFVTIENWQPPRPQPRPQLSGVPSGRVHVAFFDRSQTSEMPDYEIGMRYFDNGVADDLAMNFGDFVLAGRLEQFSVKQAPRC